MDESIFFAKRPSSSKKTAARSGKEGLLGEKKKKKIETSMLDACENPQAGSDAEFRATQARSTASKSRVVNNSTL